MMSPACVALRRGLLIRMNEWTPTCRVKAGRSTARCREGISWISRNTRGSTKTRSSARPCAAHWFAAKKVTRTSVPIALLDPKEASAAKSYTAHGNLPDTRRFVNVNVGGPERAAPPSSLLPFAEWNWLASRPPRRSMNHAIEIGKGCFFLFPSPDLSSCSQSSRLHVDR